jgi:hypothetical protein
MVPVQNRLHPMIVKKDVVQNVITARYMCGRTAASKHGPPQNQIGKEITTLPILGVRRTEPS